ncbi:GNAT family N-acetyltransferase [Sphingobacterium bambusae]|uniref:GNAT family N-acetyltransferase n=1 Tax=Sphingobacterium bambusae TaxID=662858 RepID=A0ABW6BKX0_9SPHI|nr:GNAT family N-acetyltransferase [Sphingobacterium bambusae]WPL50954.1 GNAT family N-acetyltransferase [Sphingobacterium bambusae]
MMQPENRRRPPYTHYPLLADERVSLREIVNEDLHALMEISYYDGQQAQNVLEAEQMLDRIRLDYQRGDSLHWAIVDTNSGKIVGTCGYYRGFANNAGELGCILLAPYRGQGYMSAALSLAIAFGQQNMALERIWAATDRSNAAAQALLARLHFVQGKSMGSEDELLYEYWG